MKNISELSETNSYDVKTLLQCLGYSKFLTSGDNVIAEPDTINR